MSNKWFLTKESGSVFALKLFVAIFNLLGRKVCLLLLYPITFYFYVVKHDARQASIEFQTQAEFYKTQKELTFWATKIRSYFNMLEFGRALTDKFSAWLEKLEFKSLHFEGKDDLRSLINTGQGAIILGAHVGNLEVLRALTSELKDVTVNALMFTDHNPIFNSVLQQEKPDAHLRIIPVRDIDPALVIELQERVQAGQLVAMLADRITPGAQDKNIACEFMGKTASFPSGPFILAHLLKCPVFLVFCFREGSDYRVIFEVFAPKINLPANIRKRELPNIVERYVMRLEHFASQYPLQWFNFYGFWDVHPRHFLAGNQKGSPPPARDTRTPQ